MFNGDPNCRRDVDCENWRCEDIPEVRSNGRVELSRSLKASRNGRIVDVMMFGTLQE
jgi:hypothetical protein